MLLDLHVRGFVLITDLHLSWQEGLTALTGETGAGKSIIIDALAALLGAKVSAADIVQTGAEAAYIEAEFRLSPAARAILDELGIEPDDEVLVVSREINRNGRSRCRINGHMVTVGAMQRLGSVLVDIHSQHESQWLLSSSRQLEMLDAFGGRELAECKEAVADLAKRLTANRAEIERLRANELERNRQLDVLRYQVDEIAAARLQEGEDAALEEERAILAHAETLATQLDVAYAALYESDGGAAADLVGQAVASLAEAARFDPRSREIFEALQGLESLLAEHAREIRRRRDSVHADPERLAEVEARLVTLEKLKRKYGGTVAEILAYAERAAQEIEALEHSEQHFAALEQEARRLEAEYLKATGQLHDRRAHVAVTLSQLVQSELADLGMERAAFAVRLDKRIDPSGVAAGEEMLAISQNGYDSCEFMFSANPGEEPRPLARVASGGELSRVMLAIKAVLASIYSVPTLIFDEVDAGIGGRTAQAVAQKLAQIARGRQVICVTHLAQLAAAATNHIQIDKVVDGQSTRIHLHRLSPQERVHELARMLDGTQREATLAHARQMLAMTQKGPS